MRLAGAFRAFPILGAIVILFVVNAALLRIDPLQSVNPDQLPAARTWSWWACQDYKKRTPAPDIAILGCSIVMHATWFAEATHRNKPVELIVDHESTALADQVAKLVPGLHPTAFNFGLPGAMLSDDCMIVRAMFNGDNTPKVVVLGVSPRDTFDNTFNTPAGTKHYQYLARFAPAQEPDDLLVPRVWERPKFWLQHAIYFKDKCKGVQNICSAAIRKVSDPLLSHLGSSPLDAVPEAERELALFKDELDRGFWIARPNSPYRYLESSADAKRKVGSLNPGMHRVQKQWLELLMQACRDRNIDVVLVNLPASDVALKAMGPAAYQRHLTLMHDVARRWHVPLVDTNVPGRYVATDWTDWGHMTDKGGQKTLDAAARAIADNSRLVARLKDTHAGQVAGASSSPAGN